MVEGFISELKNQQPLVWQLLQQAEVEGLIHIDESVDAITPTNRLLWTYPGLHEVLVRIINELIENQHTDFGQVTHLLREALNP